MHILHDLAVAWRQLAVPRRADGLPTNPPSWAPRFLEDRGPLEGSEPTREKLRETAFRSGAAAPPRDDDDLPQRLQPLVRERIGRRQSDQPSQQDADFSAPAGADAALAAGQADDDALQMLEQWNVRRSAIRGKGKRRGAAAPGQVLVDGGHAIILLEARTRGC